MKTGRTHGFTLPEIMIAVGIAGMLAALAVPRFGDMVHRSRLNGTARSLAADLKQARSLAVTRRVLQPGTDGPRAVQAGLRIDGPTRYALFLDPDDDPTNLNEVDVQLVDLTSIDASGGLRIEAPAPGTQIRFDPDGSTTATELVLTSAAGGGSRHIELTGGGQTRVD
jgi:prepilin-type N-terminal cleavage/methylation domain-containing protein